MKLNSIQRKELLRFLVGGGSAVATDYCIYQMGMRLIGLEQPLAKGISFLCGSAVGFVINKLWTFESRSFQAGELLRYALLYTVTAVLNALVNQAAVSVIPIEIFGFLCATGVSTILNFLGQKFFVFRPDANAR